jgi:hypothetical protein
MLKIAFLFAILAISSVSSGFTNAYFFNATPYNITLNFASNEFGYFSRSPPDTIAAWAMGQWQVSGSLIGWMQYYVYYSTHDGNYCARAGYLWDVVFGQCDSIYSICPMDSPEQKKKEGPEQQHTKGGYFAIFDNCSPEGTPMHTLKYIEF